MVELPLVTFPPFSKHILRQVFNNTMLATVNTHIHRKHTKLPEFADNNDDGQKMGLF